MSLRLRRHWRRQAARESELVVPSPHLWLPGREWPERSPFARGLADSPYIGNPTCPCPDEICSACEGAPNTWAVDLTGVSASNAGCDNCPGLAAIWAAPFKQDIANSCEWQYVDPVFCSSTTKLLVTVRTVGVDTARKYTVNLGLTVGSSIAIHIWHSATWDTTINPSCLHLADGNGDISASLVSSTWGIPAHCSGTVPATVKFWDANP